jgi:hypothetical protein
MARLHLPQTVNISSALITTMEAPIGTNSATRFKGGISRNAASILKANWDERKDLLCSLYPGNDHYRGTRFYAT